MARDETTYGFNKHDAESLLRHVGGGDSEYLEGKVRGGSNASAATIAAFVTPGGGIAARSGSTLGSATCTRLTLSGGTRATTTTTVTVYNNFLSAVGASVDIKAAQIDGIWVVLAEDCS